jgi:hypothetical protein
MSVADAVMSEAWMVIGGGNHDESGRRGPCGMEGETFWMV